MINYLTKTIVINKIEEFDKNYNIVCCTDEKFLRALGVLLISILENNTGNFAFHIFYRGNLSIENEQKLRQIAYSYKISLIVYCIDDSQFTTLHTTDVINLVTYYRFIAPYILADLNIAKILYLDVDMLCVGDIKKLFDIELKDNIAYTVKDPTDIAMKKYCESIGADSDNYFNAGMLLINVQRYVEEDIGQKAICLLKKKKYYFMDQDVLNILMKNKVIADIKIDYNCTMSTRNNAFKNNKNKPKLIHFTMSRKPWKIYTSMWGGEGSLPMTIIRGNIHIINCGVNIIKSHLGKIFHLINHKIILNGDI